jgi:uncharacterized protein (TIGR02246 family)
VKLRAAILGAVLAVCALPSLHAETSSLRSTLDAHLAAINARDLDALLATVTRGEQLTLVLPNGTLLTTREAFRQLHVDWFADRGWRMQFEVESVRAFGDVGIALVRYRSQAKQADGSYATKREAWLNLTFAREDGDWRLVFDQNTVIPPP